MQCNINKSDFSPSSFPSLERQNKISTAILLTAGCTTLVCAGGFVVLDLYAGVNADPAFILFATFLTFVVTYLGVYFFYFVSVARRIRQITEKVRTRFFQSQIPEKADQLEEEDLLEKLDAHVEALSEVRERESAHFENLDSYRKEYLGNVSHELKTPIFNIQGYIDTLLNGGLEDPAVNRDYLQRAEKSIDRLISIIDDLETITQLESGVLELDLDDFDIAALCRDVLAGLEMPAAKKQIRLEMGRRSDKPVMVRADKFRIRQVLVNLVANSIKYGVENGTTVLTLSYRNDDVVVEVSDNGPGIDEAHLGRIFERFYRVDKGRSREQGGTGLGLSIVKHIIEAHNRTIRVECPPGGGTRFIFSLPASA